MAIVNSALAPFTLKGFYLLTWGTALGSNVWSALSGYKSYKSMPRTAFGTLQSNLVPFYLGFQTLTTSTLLLTHLYFHPDLISSPLVEPHWATCEEGRQGMLIVGSVIASVVNYLIVAPLTTKVMLDRHRQERLEGKEYDAPTTSGEMSSLNIKFSTLHAVSSALNTAAVVCLAGLGLVISM